jgi:hypothetical protein
MATTNSEIDPVTGLPKKTLTNTLSPYTAQTTPAPATNPNDPNAMVSLSKEALKGSAVQPLTSTGFNTNQANTDVLGAAQKGVLSQGTSPSALQTTVTGQAQKFAENPFGTFDPAAYKQAQLEKADTDWSKSFEGLQQKYGNASGSGLLQKNLLENSLQHNVDQRTLDQQIEAANYDKYLQGMQAGITTGQNVNKSNEDIFSQRLGNLANVRTMAEGERSQAADQKFQGVENEANRTEAARQFNTEQDFKKWATEGGWNQDDINRAWQSTEAGKQRASTEKIAQWNIDTEKWKTDQATALTKQGWTEEAARQKTQIDADMLKSSLDRELNKYIADNNLTLKEKEDAQQAAQFQDELSYKRWATQSGLDDASANRAWQASQNALKISADQQMQRETLNNDTYNKELDRSLTKEIETLKLTQEDKALAQQALLAGNELEWNKTALSMNLDADKAKQIWQSAENSKDRAQALTIANNQLELQTQQLTASIEQFNKTYGLESSKFAAGVDQWRQEFGQKVQEWQTATGIEKQRLAQELQISNNQMANQITLATIDNEARLKGINLQATLDNLQNMDPTTAAETLMQVMQNSGLDTTKVAENVKNYQSQPIPMVVGQQDSPNLEFRSDGTIATPSGSIGLTNGQSLQLTDNFKVSGLSNIIPAGKYTVVTETSDVMNKKTYPLLKSVDNKYYVTGNAEWRSKNGLKFHAPYFPGYTYNEKDGYYTKN